MQQRPMGTTSTMHSYVITHFLSVSLSSVMLFKRMDASTHCRILSIMGGKVPNPTSFIIRSSTICWQDIHVMRTRQWLILHHPSSIFNVEIINGNTNLYRNVNLKNKRTEEEEEEARKVEINTGNIIPPLALFVNGKTFSAMN